uniref:Uncharacterized protein n=1 Tax=Tetradesmus obliquus TaxID=3088 RepID=A0A383W3E5_TETOB|eukprot:jgi/Sobl393_1/4719/SZX71544.1
MYVTDPASRDVRGVLQPSPLQLGHLTGLSKLAMEGTCLSTGACQLPPNLLELELSSYDRTDGIQVSVQPLLALTRLERLQVLLDNNTKATLMFAQLSSLSSLQEVSLAFEWSGASPATWEETEATAAGIAAAWRVLPLRELRWSIAHMPAAVLQQISALTGLTNLALSGGCAGRWYGCLQATHAEFALARTQLTALRQLSIQGFGRMAMPSVGDDVVAALEVGGLPAAAHLYAAEVSSGMDALDTSRAYLHHGCGSIALLLQAVGTLSALREVCVVLPVQLKSAQQRRVMQDVLQQVLPKRIMDCLEVAASRVAVEL